MTLIFILQILIVIQCVFCLDNGGSDNAVVRENKTIKVNLNIVKPINQFQYIQATLYLGKYLQPYLMNIQIDSDKIWVRNQTCYYCQDQQKSIPITNNNKSQQKCQLVEQVNNKLNQSFICVDTCNIRDNLTQKNSYKNGSIYSIQVNDAIGFNKNLEEVIFHNFSLITQIDNLDLSKETSDGVLGLPYSSENVVQQMFDQQIISNSIFIINLFTHIQKAIYPYLLIGGISEDQKIPFKMTQAINFNNKWAFNVSGYQFQPNKTEKKNYSSFVVLTTNPYYISLQKEALQSYSQIQANLSQANCSLSSQQEFDTFYYLYCFINNDNILTDINLSLSVNVSLLISGESLIDNCSQSNVSPAIKLCKTKIALSNDNITTLGFTFLENYVVLFDFNNNQIGFSLFQHREQDSMLTDILIYLIEGLILVSLIFLLFNKNRKAIFQKICCRRNSNKYYGSSISSEQNKLDISNLSQSQPSEDKDYTNNIEFMDAI